jgi:hypothetical protein
MAEEGRGDGLRWSRSLFKVNDSLQKVEGIVASTVVNHLVCYFNRVVHSSHFQAIFGSFSISFLFSFFKNGVQNEMKMNWKMEPFPPFRKNGHFWFHFHV